MTIVVNNSTLVEDLIIEVVLGVVGFFLSERYKRTRGVPPWRCPSAVWALVWFLFPLLGAIVYAIACFTTRPPANPSSWPGAAQSWNAPPSAQGQAPQGGWGSPPPPGWGPQQPQGWGAPPPGRWEAPPGYQGAPPPGGWEAPPAAGTAYPGFTAPGPEGTPPASQAAPEAPPARQVPRSWLADPAGRHELRYWDGTKFTEHVADAGKISIDPL